MTAFNRKRKVFTSAFTIQQTIIRVCRRTNNYFVALLCTSVSSFLLQGLDREQEARFAGYAIFKITLGQPRKLYIETDGIPFLRPWDRG